MHASRERERERERVSSTRRVALGSVGTTARPHWKKGGIAAALRSFLILVMLLGPCLAQNPYAGAWGPVFNHKVSTTSAPHPNATDPGFESGGLDAMTFYVQSNVGTLGWPVATASGTMFEAVHMSLIPKGPNRGKLLVWNIEPVLCKAPTYDPTLPANLWWACQAYAIVDFSPTATDVFQNFLLPIERVDPLGQTPSYPLASDLFCAGHCWTQFGDLVVLGGTTFNPAGLYTGPIMTYVFNPDANNAPFPQGPWGTYTQPLYGTAPNFPQGLWVRGPT